MRNLGFSIAFIAFNVLLLLAGLMIASGLLIVSTACVLLPISLWVNGFFVAKAGIRLAIENNESIDKSYSSNPVKKPIRQEFQ